MLAYRTSVQETTGASPFSLMFGREARLPIDVMFGLPTGQIPTSPNQYALTLRHNLENIYHKVSTRMGLKQSRQKELYDQKTKGVLLSKQLTSFGSFAQLFPGESPGSFTVPGRGHTGL